MIVAVNPEIIVWVVRRAIWVPIARPGKTWVGVYTAFAGPLRACRGRPAALNIAVGDVNDRASRVEYLVATVPEDAICYLDYTRFPVTSQCGAAGVVIHPGAIVLGAVRLRLAPVRFHIARISMACRYREAIEDGGPVCAAAGYNCMAVLGPVGVGNEVKDSLPF